MRDAALAMRNYERNAINGNGIGRLSDAVE